jgi:hypothetical protein
MEKEFVPYQQSLDMKELGFDEPCFNYYDGNKNKNSINLGNGCVTKYMVSDNFTIAPLYQQAFRWFREKEIDSEFKKIEEGYTFHCFKNQEELSESLLKLFSDDRKKYVYKTYEEAQLECLKKLIEIVKEKK